MLRVWPEEFYNGAKGSHRSIAAEPLCEQARKLLFALKFKLSSSGETCPRSHVAADVLRRNSHGWLQLQWNLA